jgi:glycosyltransferase involved in cell wall biosynthesis
MTETLPKVSVVCAWYNRADYIRDTIDSLLAQDYPNFDITVVNDGSPDPRVREILDSYTDPRLRVIHQDNTGFTRAIRRAIDESDGTYIAIQGAGDISLSGRLSAQVRYLEENDQVVAVGTGHKLKEPNGAKTIVEPATATIDEAGLKRKTPFTQGTVVYTRDIWNKVDGYNTFFHFCQDWDFYRRIVKHGEIHGLPDILYVKYVFADGASVQPEKKVKQYCYAKVANGCAPLERYFKKVDGQWRPMLTKSEQLVLSAKIILTSLVKGQYQTVITWLKYAARLPFMKVVK